MGAGVARGAGVGVGSASPGYSRAFQYLMQQLGIPCYYCTGYSGENHAWNIVYLYGEYYNVDLTWDDTEPTTYDFFNKTDADYADTHVRRGLAQKLPACEGVSYRNLEETPGEAEPTPTPAPRATPAPTGTLSSEIPLISYVIYSVEGHGILIVYRPYG